MSNIKITELPELAATPADADILEIVDDVGVTPTSKKITARNLRGGLAASGANTDITSILNAALYLGRDADNKIDFATDDHLKVTIAGTQYDLVSISGITETSVEDESEITLDTAKTGWGTAMAGDNEEFIQFRFTAAGVVTIISNSANAINTNTDGFLCVYDAGTGIRIKNRLGATKTIRYIVNYS